MELVVLPWQTRGFNKSMTAYIQTPRSPAKPHTCGRLRALQWSRCQHNSDLLSPLSRRLKPTLSPYTAIRGIDTIVIRLACLLPESKLVLLMAEESSSSGEGNLSVIPQSFICLLKWEWASNRCSIFLDVYIKTSLRSLNLMSEHLSHPLGICFGKSNSLSTPEVVKIQDATN